MRVPFPAVNRAQRPFPVVPGGVEYPKIKLVQSVVRAACEVTGVTRSEIRSERRMKHITRARHIVHWVSCRCTGASLPEIGRRLGGQDHTTVLHGFRKVEHILSDDGELAFDIDRTIRRAIEIEAEPRPDVLVSDALVSADIEVEPKEPGPLPIERIHELRSKGLKASTIAVFIGEPYQRVARHLGLAETGR